jgi:hypothetical protein
MLFAKKRQQAVLRLVELPAAGDFLRAPQEKKVRVQFLMKSRSPLLPILSTSLLKLGEKGLVKNY